MGLYFDFDGDGRSSPWETLLGLEIAGVAAPSRAAEEGAPGQEAAAEPSAGVEEARRALKKALEAERRALEAERETLRAWLAAQRAAGREPGGPAAERLRAVEACLEAVQKRLGPPPGRG